MIRGEIAYKGGVIFSTNLEERFILVLSDVGMDHYLFHKELLKTCKLHMKFDNFRTKLHKKKVVKWPIQGCFNYTPLAIYYDTSSTKVSYRTNRSNKFIRSYDVKISRYTVLVPRGAEISSIKKVICNIKFVKTGIKIFNYFFRQKH